MLYVSFLWHMHQPWYLDPESGHFALPWVRLHGTKDYLDMAALVKEFPSMQAVINVTPVLLEQIELYSQGVQDEHQILSRKPAKSLTAHETARLLEIGFKGISEKIIHPYPRYFELMAKAQRSRSQPFSAQEVRDLQVWSNLAWMDPRWRREDPVLGQMVKKGSGFTEQEKEILLRTQLDLLAQIIRTYRALQESGQIELSISPWSHPILPLLHNTDAARQTNPGTPLPGVRFQHPEDVTWHLETAVNRYKDWFGQPPQGLWPSEGSVSQEIVPAIAQAGFQWMATDEEILWKSLGGASRAALYHPYRLQAGNRSLQCFFRDHVLADRIGFVYSSWPTERAANDFLQRLKEIEQAASKQTTPALVLVALDGENAWESYPEDGEPFLRALYGLLSRESTIRCCTPSEYLKAHSSQETLPALASGSWIRGEFSTWIGHPFQNKAWEELEKARRFIGPQKSRSMAIAEGSDWFWWLGPEHSSADDPVFDRIFRMHLKKAYQEAQRSPPETLDQPIHPKAVAAISSPTGFITPTIDGKVSSYFEWLYAGEVDLTHTGSAMARARPFFARFWWGCDDLSCYFRLDPSQSLSDVTGEVTIREEQFQITLMLDHGMVRESSLQRGKEREDRGVASPDVQTQLKIASGKILELAVPLTVIRFTHGQTMKAVIFIEQEGLVLERYPEYGTFELAFPIFSQAQHHWSA